MAGGTAIGKTGSKARSDKKPKKSQSTYVRPEPGWLFLLAEALSQEKKSEELKIKEEDEKQNIIKWLQQTSTITPEQAAPPAHLLQLVNSFLTTFGFNSSAKLLALECDARKVLPGWDNEVNVAEDSSLIQIYDSWRKDQKPEDIKLPSSDESDSSDSGDSSDNTEDSEDSEESEDAEESEGAEESENEKTNIKSTIGAKLMPNGSIIKAKAISSSSESSSSSDTSSDSGSGGESELEDETEAPKAPVLDAGSSPTTTLKRKAEDLSSSEDSGSDTGSDSSEGDAPSKKAKTSTVNSTSAAIPRITVPDSPAKTSNIAKASSASSSSSGSSSSSDSDSGEDSDAQESMEEDIKATTHPAASGLAVKTKLDRKFSNSDSSTTLKAISPQKTTKPADTFSLSESSDSDSSSSSDNEADNKPTKIEIGVKRKSPPSARPAAIPTPAKLPKTTSTPFSRIPADTKVDPRFASNKYISYDYANRAHQDLIVTKGKGFTKEKNKKKRGA